MKDVKCLDCDEYRNEWCEKIVDSPHPDIIRDCQYWHKKKDMVEVIRCKDCKHKPILDEDDEPEFPTNRCPCQCDDFYYSWMPKDDWFCANAERRTDV